MQLEVDIALNFLLSFLYNKLPRRRVNQFGEELEKAIKIKFQDHWYAEQPSKGSAYRCLKTASPIDPILEWASLEAGIQLTDIKDNLPDELSIWIDPGEVSYRLSERSPIKIIYSVRQNTQQQQQPISCHNDSTNQQDPSDLLEPIELLESITTTFSNKKLDKTNDKTGAAVNHNADDFNFNATNAAHGILSQQQQQHDTFILNLNQEAKQNQLHEKPQLPPHQQQLHLSSKNTNDGHNQDINDYLAFFANNFKSAQILNHVPTQTNDFILSPGTEKIHQTPDMEIYEKQFKIPQTSGAAWSSGSSSSVSSVGSTIGTVLDTSKSKSTKNNQIDEICSDHSKNINNMAIINSNRSTMSGNSNDYHIQMQKINNDPLESNYCSNQSQPKSEKSHQHNSIKFPTTINDYSLLSGNANQNINHQNMMMCLRSPTKHSIVALNSFNGQTNLASSISCQQQQQSRINSRNNSFSSSNSLGGSSSSGSVVSAGSSTSSKSSRCQPSFLSGFCGPSSQQTTLNSIVDSPPLSNTKAQPLVFTAAMFAQTKFGSTKLKNQNNGHNHHTMVSGATNPTAQFNNQQHNTLRLSSLSNQNQQNLILPSNHLMASRASSFASSAMRSPNHHLHTHQQAPSHHSQQTSNQFMHQGINSNRYSSGHCAPSCTSHTRQQQSPFFSRSNDLKSGHITSPNTLAMGYDASKADHDEVYGDDRAQLFGTNELINIRQGVHHSDYSKGNHSFEKPLNGMINFEHQQNKKSMSVESDLQNNGFMCETSMLGLVDKFPMGEDLISPNGNLKVKDETMRQLESIFNLPETNCEFSSHRENEVTSEQEDLFRTKVYNSDSIDTQQEVRQMTSDLPDLTTDEYTPGGKLLDFDYTSYELWSTRTNPIVEYNSFVENMVQDKIMRVKQVQDDNDKKANEELSVDKRNNSKLSNLFLEEKSQNSCTEAPDEARRYTSPYQAYKKHDRDNDQDEIRDILMRLMLQQPVKTIASEVSSANMNTDVAMVTDVLDSNKDIIDQNYSKEKAESLNQLNTINDQAETDSNDKILEGDLNCWYKSPKMTEDTSRECKDDVSAESKENNGSFNVVIFEQNNRDSGELPILELIEKNDNLLWDEGLLATNNFSDNEFSCMRVTTTNSTLIQSADDENESSANVNDQTQLMMSSSVVDPGIISVNNSVTSANYSATSNQQCKQQTQQQTQQLLLAN